MVLDQFLKIGRWAALVLIPLGVAAYYLLGAEHPGREVLRTGGAYLSTFYFFALFVIVAFYFLRANGAGNFSVSAGFYFAISLFGSGSLLLPAFDQYLNFGLPKREWGYQFLMLDWFTKGAFFDVLESFDLASEEVEATNNKTLFDTIELIFRFLSGAWSAYMSAAIFLKFKRRFFERAEGVPEPR
jgi:hypothetical protein